MDIKKKSLEKHFEWNGKIEVISRASIKNREELSLAYTPGVAEACLAIKENPALSYKLTRRNNLVAVITDGTAVLGLGDIGPEASMPVMEGKCALLKEFAGVDAIPICINSKDTDELVRTIYLISKSFGGINLEDISAPRCFEIEEKLNQICDIPVFHDDQHGTAIVVLGALINALKIVNKPIYSVKIVVLGAGAAGTAISNLLNHYGALNITVCDRKGIIHINREDLSDVSHKKTLALLLNSQKSGTVSDAMKDADVFIGVSGPNLLSIEDVKSMKKDPIIFSLANPTPEIDPKDAKSAGAVIIGTGRSDLNNQINNVLAFPGIFMGVIMVLNEGNINKKIIIDNNVKVAVAKALASLVDNPTPEKIIPAVFDDKVAETVAIAVKNTIK